MSQIPPNFTLSDDEDTQDPPQGPKSRTDISTKVEAMSIVAGTSTTGTSASNVSIKESKPQNNPMKERELTETYHYVSRKMDEIMKMLNLLNGRQQAMYGVVVDIKKELDILKSSSARFASATATSGIKSVKKPKFLYDK